MTEFTIWPRRLAPLYGGRMAVLFATTLLVSAGCLDHGLSGDVDPSCGDGVRQVGEYCDGDCPTECPPSVDPCTDWVLVGSAEDCTARCLLNRINQCLDGDGCCAADCHSLNDSDCAPHCGNAVLEADEICDTQSLPESCSDMGFYGGTLSCAPDCLGYDSGQCTGYCGDAVRQSSEVCDGSDILGSCADLLPETSGVTVGCDASCQLTLDPAGCCPLDAWLPETTISPEYWITEGCRGPVMLLPDSVDQPHIISVRGGGTQVHHSYYDGAVWTDLLIANIELMRFDAYRDAQDRLSVVSQISDEVTWRRWSGAQWIEMYRWATVPEDAGLLAAKPDANGDPVMVLDRNLVRWDGAAWTAEPLDTSATWGPWTRSDFAFDATGLPVVVYCNREIDTLQIATHDGTGFSSVVLDPDIRVIWHLGMESDSQGRIHLAYLASRQYGSNLVSRYGVRTAEGWTFTDMPHDFNGRGLTLDRADRPFFPTREGFGYRIPSGWAWYNLGYHSCELSLALDSAGHLQAAGSAEPQITGYDWGTLFYGHQDCP